LLTIRDVWDEEILNFKDGIQIKNSLFDNRNSISDYSQINAAISNTFLSIIKRWKICPELKLEIKTS